MTRTQLLEKPANNFSRWIREQPDLDSSLGYRNYDLDSVLWHFRTNCWVLLEVKTNNTCLSQVPPHQLRTLETLDRAMRTYSTVTHDIVYKGCFLVTLRHTSPHDGNVKIAAFDGKNWCCRYRPEDWLNEAEFIFWLQWLLVG